MSGRLRPRFISVPLLGFLLFGCSTPATEVVLTIDGVGSVPTETTQIELTVYDQEGGLETIPAQPANLPSRLVLVPESGDSSRRINVQIRALDEDDDVLAVGRFISGYIADESLSARIVLHEECSEDEPCEWDVAPSELDGAQLAQSDGPMPMSGDAGFDSGDADPSDGDPDDADPPTDAGPDGDAPDGAEDAEPDAADAGVDAEPDTMDAEPDTMDAEPDTMDAEPDTMDADPDTMDAEPIDECVPPPDHPVCPSAAPTTAAGDGTEANPYILCNCTQLDAMPTAAMGHYALGADIDCSRPLREIRPMFSGVFDGRGHTINGLEATTLNAESGLFAQLDGEVRDITFRNVTVRAAVYAGVVAGRVTSMAILNDVHVRDGEVMVTEPGAAGGLLGSVQDVEATDVSVFGLTVSNTLSNTRPEFGVGGLFGVVGRGTLENALAQSIDVSSHHFAAGGIVGRTAEMSFTRVGVRGLEAEGQNWIGGVVGDAKGLLGVDLGRFQFMDVYVVGTLPAASTTGGLVGWGSWNAPPMTSSLEVTRAFTVVTFGGSLDTGFDGSRDHVAGNVLEAQRTVTQLYYEGDPTIRSRVAEGIPVTRGTLEETDAPRFGDLAEWTHEGGQLRLAFEAELCP